jgi:hypothetical protein
MYRKFSDVISLRLVRRYGRYIQLNYRRNTSSGVPSSGGGSRSSGSLSDSLWVRTVTKSLISDNYLEREAELE